MSQDFVPEHTGQESAVPTSTGAPKGLLQQMEELMAALNADLSQLDADLQSSAAERAPAAPAGPQVLPGAGGPEGELPPSPLRGF
ncbi:hypothetical protein [Streptomyces sp. NPDC012888]|uniref:hypothetical protein n=1 Tax=Streptomyces sp. NPDC012888 TaxID=3364855 RepID=UPI0036BEE275